MTYCAQWQHWVLSPSDDTMLLVSCVIGWALWMMVVLRESCLNGWWCPNWAWLMKGNLVSFDGYIVQLLEHPCACPCDTLTKLSVQFIPLVLFLTAHLHVRQGWIWRPKHIPLYSLVFVKYWKEYKHWLDLSQKSTCGQENAQLLYCSALFLIFLQ